MMHKKRWAAFVLAAALVLTGCSAGSFLHFGKGSGGSTAQKIDRPAVESAELQFAHPAAGDTIAVFDTSAGVFKAVLFPDKAPQAYDNFAGLVQAGYYNGLTFSRVESGFVVEAGQGADGRGSTIWNGSRYPAETTDSLHHYSGALCMGTDASGECASVFYVMQTLPGDQSVTQELVDQMNSAGYRAEVVSAYQTAGGAPYLDYTDTVLGQVYEGMDVVDAIGQTAVDENQKPREDITINSGLALVPHAHRQAAPDLDRLCQLAALDGAFALGTIHVQRQADHNQLSSDLLGHFAHPCRHLVAGFQGDLRGDGRCKELGAVTGGKAGAAVAVVNS